MSRRGLSLIEVLAATALLAIVVVACVPVLRDAMRVLHHAAPVPGADEIGLLADRILADPEAFGLSIEQLREGADVAWPEGRHKAPGRVTRLSPESEDESKERRAWLVFSCGPKESPVAVFRWIALPAAVEEGVQP